MLFQCAAEKSALMSDAMPCKNTTTEHGKGGVERRRKSRMLQEKTHKVSLFS